MSECDEVRTVIEDPFPAFSDEAASLVAGIVCRKVEEMAPLFGVELKGIKLLDLLITEDMKSFTRRTGRGPYTLAVFSTHFGIITQPAETLDRLRDHKRLERTITHELAHFFINRVAGPRCPVWLHEGLAQWFEGMRPRKQVMLTEQELRQLEKRWHSRPSCIRQRSRDYRTSLLLVAKIIRRTSRQTLLDSLHHIPECRNILDLEIGERTLKEWLYSADTPAELAEGEEGPGFEVVRGEEWMQQLAEEISLEEGQGKVINFLPVGEEDRASVTPLPLDQMLKDAKKKRKR